jgi:hypothetical protein
MKQTGKFGRGVSAWRWVTGVALALTLVGAQAASAASSGSATIIIFAPGAPLGSQVHVEWLNPITSTWTPVAGWEGTLNDTTVSGVPFQGFAVLPANYGQQSFRWVVLTPSSSMASSTSSTTGSAANTTAADVWGSSSPFTLPNTDGVHLDITVYPAQVLNTTNTVIATTSGTGTTGTSTTVTSTTGANTTVTNTTAASNPLLNTTLSTLIMSLNCPSGGCNAGAITGRFTGMPSNSWITVEWLDSSGLWEPVTGWQGQADFIDGSGGLVKQFGVYQQNYGQGPFRWAVYNAPSGGSLLAVSPNFNLPSADGQNEVFNLAG